MVDPVTGHYTAELQDRVDLGSATGELTRQELVSMVRGPKGVVHATAQLVLMNERATCVQLPPLLLDIQPHHAVLDMCAAPGSKVCL